MNKDLPSIFKNPTTRKFENNKRVFYSRYESIGNVEEGVESNNSNNTVDLGNASTFSEAIDNLFKNNQFIFNVPVEIISRNETLNTKIVSKVGDHLLTSSGKVIQIEDILSIRIK